MKKYVKADTDRSEDSRYQQVFADVFDKVFDNLVGDGMIQAVEMQQLVPAYDADWCVEEFEYDNHFKEIEKTARRLAQLITEDYFKNYDGGK